MRVFICGFGTVGQGFCEVLAARRQFLIDRYGEPVTVVGAMDSKTYAYDPNGFDPLELVSVKQGTGRVGTETYQNSVEVLSGVEFDILVEVSPTDVKTGGAGLRNIEYALGNGKDVITVNKGPLALKFRHLMDLAEGNGCSLRFEGSVGGAMPIINLCRDNLAGERIESIRGIFNGTCNFILNDIEGYDSACKVVILANAVFGRDVTFNDVRITGITSITEDAISLAAAHNMVIRLIGEVSESKLEVGPRLVPKGHPLGISGTLNTAQILSDLAGPVTVTGRGAGRIETASAILSDLISIMDKRARERCGAYSSTTPRSGTAPSARASRSPARTSWTY